MMKTRAFLMGVFGVLLAMPAGAVIVGVETFEYADGAIADKNGGTFWNWRNQSNTTVGGGPGRTTGLSDWDSTLNTPAVGLGAAHYGEQQCAAGIQWSGRRPAHHHG